MAITLVQSASVIGNSLAYGANVTIGNLLIAVAGDATGGSAAAFPLSDTQGNTYTALAPVSGGVSGGAGQLFYSIAKATGANTVSFTAGPANPRLLIHEFSGVAQIDKSHSASGAGNAIDSGGVTTVVAAELLFGFCINVISLGASLVPGAGWTQAQIIGFSALTEYQVVAATGTFNATMASSVAKGGVNNWLAEIATFSAAVAAQSGDYWLGGRQHETKIIFPGYSN